MTITEFIEAAAHNKIIQLVVLAIVCDTVFGVLRAIKEKKLTAAQALTGLSESRYAYFPGIHAGNRRTD